MDYVWSNWQSWILKVSYPQRSSALMWRANGKIVTACLLSPGNPWDELLEYGSRNRVNRHAEEGKESQRVMRSEKTQHRALRLRGTSVVEGGAAVKQELLKTQSSLDCGLSPALWGMLAWSSSSLRSVYGLLITEALGLLFFHPYLLGLKIQERCEFSCGFQRYLLLTLFLT